MYKREEQKELAPPRKLNAQRCMLDTFMQFPPIILNPSNKNEILRLQSTTVVSTYYVVTLVEPRHCCLRKIYYVSFLTALSN